MTVIGVDAVEALSKATDPAELLVGPRDIITPLARELARDRGVSIIVTTAPATHRISPGGTGSDNTGAARTPTSGPPTPSPARPASPLDSMAAPPPLRPPSPALHRRGAPLHPDVAPAALHRPQPVQADRSSSRKTVERVVVVGAGHVGMITAMKLAEANIVAEVVLVDIAEGLAAGVALDLTHSTALLGFDTMIRGVATVAEAGVADYVVITAGRARQPGMSRSDLVEVNAGIVGSLAREAAQVSPSTVMLIVTNPLDEMTHHAWQASGLPAERVLGMAGVLDSSRFQALTGLAAGHPPASVSALALGSHGDEMVIPLSQAKVNGTSIIDVLPAKEVTALVDRARNSGAEIVGLLKSGSAFFAPGASAARMVLAMATDSDDIIAATVRARGQYGIDDGYVGLPTRLGRQGVREIVELPLTQEELDALGTAAARIAERVASLEQASVAS
jgi:malate dehydrogenase